LIADQNYVVVRWIGGRKHTEAEHCDLPVSALNQPNTGREMYFTGTTIYTLRDGLIVQEVGEESGLNAMQQLGLIPPRREWDRGAVILLDWIGVDLACLKSTPVQIALGLVSSYIN
jgi:hypothetical protein